MKAPLLKCIDRDAQHEDASVSPRRGQALYERSPTRDLGMQSYHEHSQGIEAHKPRDR